MIFVKFLLNLALSLIILTTVTQFCRADDASLAVLEEINLARTNPHQYAQFVLAQADARSKADARAMQEAINFLNRARPLPPLGFSNGLAMGAMAHVVNQGGSGTYGHAGTDRSTPWARMARYGKWTGSAGENISYGIFDARQIVISLIVDAGVAGRGHRKNIFLNKFAVVGVACGNHVRYGTMCVMDFAGGFIENQRYTDARRNTAAAALVVE